MLRKPRFLFIHGAGGTSNKWKMIPESLRNDSILVNLPGRNNIPALSSTSIEEFAFEVNKSIKEDVIVVGHSMGGVVALELASRNSHVKGIVLASSYYRLPVDEKLLSKLKEGMFPKGLFYASFHKSVDPDLLMEEEKEIDKVPINTTYLDFLATSQYIHGKEKLRNLDIPVFIINGKEDRLLPKIDYSELGDLKSNITVKLMENTGHYVMLEQPIEFIEALQKFREQIQ